MRLGIMSSVFRRYPVEEAARRIRESGFDCTQLTPDFEGMAYARYGNASDLTGFTAEMRTRIRRAFAEAGGEVLSQGAYMELTGEDEAQRRRNIDYFAVRLRMMREMGGAVLVTESGRRPEDPAAQRAAWDRLRAALAELLPIA